VNKFHIATIGKTVGIKGFLKFHIFTDFIEQFQKNTIWETTQTNLILEIESFDSKNKLIKFKNFDSIENAKSLINLKLFSNIEKSREYCTLKEDEFFWFDIIGLSIIENDQNLGIISNIERIGNIDYLLIKTNELFSHLSKTFLIPYIERYIIKTNINKKIVLVNGGLDILENS
jgi:16S rRNA processing protein RimM